MGIELKAGEARGKVSRSARSFIDAYRPERFLIVHGGDRENAEIDATRVGFLRLEELGAAVRDFLGQGTAAA